LFLVVPLVAPAAPAAEAANPARSECPLPLMGSSPCSMLLMHARSILRGFFTRFCFFNYGSGLIIS
jgi:hypothetical protein